MNLIVMAAAAVLLSVCCCVGCGRLEIRLQPAATRIDAPVKGNRRSHPMRMLTALANSAPRPE